VVAITFLTLVKVLGHASTFLLYGVITVGAWFFIYKLVDPEKVIFKQSVSSILSR
jgi:hypothetical protein